jgi:hypothetical protein
MEFSAARLSPVSAKAAKSSHNHASTLHIPFHVFRKAREKIQAYATSAYSLLTMRLCVRVPENSPSSDRTWRSLLRSLSSSCSLLPGGLNLGRTLGVIKGCHSSLLLTRFSTTTTIVNVNHSLISFSLNLRLLSIFNNGFQKLITHCVILYLNINCHSRRQQMVKS